MNKNIIDGLDVSISIREYFENAEDLLKSPDRFKNKIKSQLELLLEFSNVYTIGITGTKGKSTTSSLIYTVLKEQGINTLLLGNIGNPVFDYIDEINSNSTLVLEMSSHQLEYMKCSPNIAILLNIYPEHLDHYESFEKYCEAKCNIFKYQNKNNSLLYNFDNKPSSDIYIKNDYIFFKDKEIYNINEERNLLGDYNLNNIMFVLGVSEILKLNLNKTIESIKNFKPLAHRLEYIGKVDNVLYYDNSIGTVPMATIEAIKALKKVDTLIIGGMDRGIDYTDFIKYLNNSDINNIICMPKTGHDIAKKLNKEKAYIVENLEEAVNIAKKVTEKNKICLLSPTAASYGFFKNFEEKGEIFKKLVGANRI